ncbi:MAG: tetratricopeptide repeat protein [Azospirillum sp.]|nr:tetratricopeptide repeat protein [Azospirillum sp.]
MATLAQALAAALGHHQAGRLAEAETLYRRILAVEPDHAEALHLLGVVHHQQGDAGGAIALIGRAIARVPHQPSYHNNLGNALHDLGRLDEAGASYRTALALNPAYVGARYNLANVLQQLGHHDQAAGAYAEVLALEPGHAGALNNLGVTCEARGDLAVAEDHYRRALARQPGSADAANNLANMLQKQGRLDQAIALYETVLRLTPAFAEAHSNLLFTLMCRPGIGLAEAAAAAARWNQAHAARFRPSWRRGAPAEGRRPPRLGFVSGDFRDHAVGHLVLPTLQGLHRRGHRLFCYSNSATEDDVTARFRATAAQWRPVTGWPDDRLAEQIRADGIDILFDLSGHTAFHRLLTFARKPAPIQVTWAGYVGTTGLDAMDYLIADAIQVPAGADAHYRERIARLPHGYVGWQPPAEAPAVDPLPARQRGQLRFGSFNTLRKISPAVIALWCRLLHRLPAADLLLKTPILDCEAVRRRLLARFADQGIGEERVILSGGSSRAGHLAAMAAVDIALDPYPYSGGLTTLESLWMGVPVVTWPSETLGSRHAAGYLSAVGLPDLIASTLEDYIEIAAGLAADLSRLEHLRATLRRRVMTSPVCDLDRFVQDFETACRTMWEIHSAGQPPHGFTVDPPPAADRRADRGGPAS